MGPDRATLVPMVSGLTIALLVAIGLMATAQKGPPVPAVYAGASPYNTGDIGTSYLAGMLESKGANVVVVKNLTTDLARLGGERCVFVDISPERPYTRLEAAMVLGSLGKCNSASLLIADEQNTSNAFFELLGMPAYIPPITIAEVPVPPEKPSAPYEQPQRVPVVAILLRNGTRLFLPLYPAARLTVGNETFNLTLDIASVVALEPSPNSPAVIGRARVGSEDYAVAIAGRAAYGGRELAVVAISDGSIFLNQVLEANATYRRFAERLFGELCGDLKACTVAFDNTRYSPIPLALTELANQTVVPAYASWPSVIAGAVSQLIHPSAWLPVLVSSTNELLERVRANALASSALAVAASLAALLFLGRGQGFVKDSPLPEQREAVLVYTKSLSDEVERGKLKLTREDFVSLYGIVSDALEGALGARLSDPSVVPQIARLMGDEWAKKYYESMNKLLAKATGKSRRPLLVFWGREVRKWIAESDKLLSKLGYGLTSARGYEYLLK